jgi:hypothetical protein
LSYGDVRENTSFRGVNEFDFGEIWYKKSAYNTVADL